MLFKACEAMHGGRQGLSFPGLAPFSSIFLHPGPSVLNALTEAESGFWTPNTELKLRGRVLAEVEKNSLIALPGEGGLSLLKSSKLCGLNLEGVVRSLIVIIQRGWDQIVDILRGSPDGLVVSYVGVSITKLLVPTGLGSSCLGEAYSYNSFSLHEGLSLCKASQKYFCVSLKGEPGPCPKVALLFL